MFKVVQCEYHWSHDTHQADSPILPKRVPALHCQWLQELLLFVPSAHPSFLQELDYRLNVCRVTNGAHTEHL